VRESMDRVPVLAPVSPSKSEGTTTGWSRFVTPEQARTLYPRCLARVRAAFFAAPERPAAPLVVTALRAAAERAEAPRFEAAERAWRASAPLDAEPRPSRLSAPVTARDRVLDVECGCAPAARLRCAFRTVRLEV